MTSAGVKRRAKEILLRLGEITRWESHDDKDDYALRYCYSYDGYGFAIRLSYDTDYVRGYEWLKEHLWAVGDLLVRFNGWTVYDENGTYRHGEWEDLFDLLYNKVSALETEKKMIEELCGVLDVYYKPDGIDNFLKEKNLTWYMKECTEGDVETYDYRHYSKHKIRKNGRLVLDIDYYGNNYDSVMKEYRQEYKLVHFEQGVWQGEFLECLNEARNARARRKAEELSKKTKNYYDILNSK